MNKHYGPRDRVEEQLVQRIARCLWRLAMSAAMEERMLGRRGLPANPGASYERIMRYERLVDIHLHRAMSTLTRKRELEKRCNAQNELAPRFY